MLTASLRAALGATLLLVCCTAPAQTGASVALVSDYRYRGISLSDEQPTLRLAVTHDAASGWYAGGSLAGVTLEPARRQLQLLGYLGRSGRLSPQLHWEAGALVVHFGADSRFDYQEGFAGLQGDRWSTRIHFSPDYFGSGARTAYGELNAGLPVSRFTRAAAHVGALMRVGGASAESQRLQFDASMSLALARDLWELQVDLVTGGRSGIYPVVYGRTHAVVVLSASHVY